ncbi:MAG TPA: TlpA disulfide reductase family protein [Candidatus Thermoplasmatota archaeon]|nr:TlpA disulfide reductase family protein [Candidatus Thermoplasmatota archaeon]
MAPRRRAALALLLALPLAGCLGGSLEGEPVPAFEVVTNEGERVTPASFAGRWLVLDLMATWCQPCKLEVRHLQEVQRLHGDRVAILSVSVEPTDTLADMEAFRNETGAAWSYALDPGLQVARAMRLGNIPKLLVVDPQGTVVLEAENEVLPAAINRAIEGGPPAPLPWMPALAAAAVGLLAPFNPYRRLHREGGAGATMLGLAILAALAVAAWPLAAPVSARATLGSLLVGALALLAVPWWWRARRRAAPDKPPALLPAALDRAYEGAPHLALAVVLALQQPAGEGFALVVGAFLLAAAAGVALRLRVPEARRLALGMWGLVLAGLGLLAFGSRIFLA